MMNNNNGQRYSQQPQHQYQQPPRIGYNPPLMAYPNPMMMMPNMPVTMSSVNPYMYAQYPVAPYVYPQAYQYAQYQTAPATQVPAVASQPKQTSVYSAPHLTNSLNVMPNSQANVSASGSSALTYPSQQPGLPIVATTTGNNVSNSQATTITTVQPITDSSKNLAQQEQRILKDSSSILEKYRKLLNNNGRKDGWNSLLLDDDRRQVETILKEADEFDVHYANFEREFNKMSQTTSSSGDTTLKNYSTMWSDWRDNLLNRRKQMMQLQEDTLKKLYKKICDNNPSFHKNIVIESQNKTTSSNNNSNSFVGTNKPETTNSSVELKEPPPAIIVNQSVASASIVAPPITLVNETKRTDLGTNKKNNNNNTIKEAASSFGKKLKPPLDWKTKNLIESALENQEMLSVQYKRLFEDVEYMKKFNEFVFLRNQINFLDGVVIKSRRRARDDTGKIFSDKQLALNLGQDEQFKKVDKNPIVPSNPGSTMVQNIPAQTIIAKVPQQQQQQKPKSVEKLDGLRQIQIQVSNRSTKESENKNLPKNQDSTPKFIHPVNIQPAVAQKLEPILVERTNNIQVPIVKEPPPPTSLPTTSGKKRRRQRSRSLKMVDKVSGERISPTDVRRTARVESSYFRQPASAASIEPTSSSHGSFFHSTYYEGPDRRIASTPSSAPLLEKPEFRSFSPSPEEQDIQSFLLKERKNLQEKLSFTDSRFFTVPRKYSEEPLYIKDLLEYPARSYRPPKVVFIIRGLPGSGKSFMARLIKEKEEEKNALIKVKLLSIDDYFLIEKDVCNNLMHGSSSSSRSMTKSTEPILVYEYDDIKEIDYKYLLFKEFRKTVMNSGFDFVLVDSVNPSINDVRHFYATAIENSYIPYVIEMESIVRRILDDCVEGGPIVDFCFEQNRHGRTRAEIQRLYDQWELLPVDYLRIDAFSIVSETGRDLCKSTMAKVRRLCDDDEDDRQKARPSPQASMMNHIQPAHSNHFDHHSSSSSSTTTTTWHHYPTNKIAATIKSTTSSLEGSYRSSFHEDDHMMMMMKRRMAMGQDLARIQDESHFNRREEGSDHGGSVFGQSSYGHVTPPMSHQPSSQMIQRSTNWPQNEIVYSSHFDGSSHQNHHRPHGHPHHNQNNNNNDNRLDRGAVDSASLFYFNNGNDHLAPAPHRR